MTYSILRLVPLTDDWINAAQLGIQATCFARTGMVANSSHHLTEWATVAGGEDLQ